MPMKEGELLKSKVSEYRGLVQSQARKGTERVDMEALIADLSALHDWTEPGARAIVSLASEYGAFMLRNAFALAVAMNKEDGDLRF